MINKKEFNMPSGFPTATNSKLTSTSSRFWKKPAEKEAIKAIETVKNTLDTLSNLQSSLSALNNLCKEWGEIEEKPTKVSSPTLSSS